MSKIDDYLAITAHPTWKDRLRKQWAQVEGSGASVTCGCRRTLPLEEAFRCYYCGEFFCARCAARHFGQTFREYHAEQP